MKKYAYAAIVAALVPAAANAGTVGGRIGLRLGYETPTVSGDGDVYKIGSAVSYGGEAGVDVHLGKVVIGPFAEYDFSNVSTCDSGYCLNVKGALNAGGRIGFLVGRTGQVYVKANYSRMTLTATSPTDSASDSEGGVGGAIGNIPMVIVKVQTASAGAEVGLVELSQPAPTSAAATKSSRASAIRRGITSFSVPATCFNSKIQSGWSNGWGRCARRIGRSFGSILLTERL